MGKKEIWHLVNPVLGKHAGPFSSELDCVMARTIAHSGWSTSIPMDRKTFDAWLAADA